MELKFTGAGVFVETDPIDVSDIGGKEWSPRLTKVRVYAYVRFYTLEHADYGVFLSGDGPEGAWEESVSVGDQRFMEPVSQWGEFGDAISHVNEKWAFEEVPYVEVLLKKDYDEAVLAQLGEDLDEPRTWKLTSLQDVKDGDWEGPGLYDFREQPPTSVGSVAKNEIEDMEFAAQDTLDYMYQDDEWKKPVRKMLAEAA